MVTKKEVLEHLQTYNCKIKDDAALQKCLELCNKWSLTGEELIDMWLIFCSNNGLEDQGVNLTRLNKMETEMLQKENKSQVAIHETAIADDNTPMDLDIESNILGMYGCNQLLSSSVKRTRSPENEADRTPKIQAMDDSFSSDITMTPVNTPSLRYTTSSQSGRVLLTYGGKVLPTIKSDYRIRVTKFNTPHVPSDAKYMFDTLFNKSSILTFICKSIGERLCDIWNAQEKSDLLLTPQVRRLIQGPFRTWGRISQDPANKTIILQGSEWCIRSKKPPFITLNLQEVQNYSVYPGQIVAVEGTILDNVLNVRKLFTEGYVPLADTPRLREKINIVVAAGPFTTSDGLHFQPLWDLMKNISENEPHLVILVGPFLEQSHPYIKGLKCTYDDCFNRIITRIADEIRGKSTHVVIVSSNRDAHHDVIFPTPEYSTTKANELPNLHLMPDPTMLDIDGLVIGITSVDVLKHLSHVEMTNSTVHNRMTRLANHVLAQSCFYPIYPPFEKLCVDTTLWEKYAFFDRQPHMMILPSDIHYFCKPVNKTVVINPERLTKFHYANISVGPITSNQWIANYVKCEIIQV
ncbi:DNA polymerase alpha subunit B isoform X2 [Prorops nasuta]|uniref:DNA polymerase alpha subunit B isoform X2 n=1 Tax=Prorops nasuta TaxID=863751 RepID=UPI0034CE266F